MLRIKRHVKNYPEIAGNTIIYSKKLHCGYIVIPKAGNRSMKAWLSENSEFSGEFYQFPGNPNDFAKKFLSYKAWKENGIDVEGYIESCFLFTFIRSPGQRLLSGFVDKCVGGVAAARDPQMSKNISDATLRTFGYSISPNEITFRQFVHSLCKMNSSELDLHFRDQVWFLKTFRPNFVGTLDTLERDVAILKNYVSLSGKPPHLTRSRPDFLQEEGAFYADYSAHSLRELSRSKLAHNSFFDREILSCIQDRFSADQKIYDRACAGCGLRHPLELKL
jgi:hypothetical protein